MEMGPRGGELSSSFSRYPLKVLGICKVFFSPSESLFTSGSFQFLVAKFYFPADRPKNLVFVSAYVCISKQAK
jgi:hypothetical protein